MSWFVGGRQREEFLCHSEEMGEKGTGGAKRAGEEVEGSGFTTGFLAFD